MLEPVQFCAGAPLKRPQSSTLRSSWPRRPPVSTALEVESVNVPGTLPVFAMSTVPLTLSPGFMFGALNSALEVLLPIVRVPAVKVLAGLAACAVKFAPEPTVMPTAASTTASAPTVRRGCATRAERRDTGNGLRRRGTRGHGRSLSPCWLDPLRSCDREAAGGSRLMSGSPRSLLRPRGRLLPFSPHHARAPARPPPRPGRQRASASDAGVSGSQSTAPP